MGPTFSLPQESLDPLLPPQYCLLFPPLPHLLTDMLTRSLSHLNQMHAVISRPRSLSPAPNHHKHRQGTHEQPIAHVQGALLLATGPIMCAVPLLPVLPRSIPRGTAGLTAPSTIGISESLVGHVVSAGPAGAVEIVGAPLGGVGKDGVGGDDEAVAVELGSVGQSGGGGMWVAIGVV